MTRPSKFEIMRINRGCSGYLNHKAQLIEEVDSAELHVLRTLRQRQAEEDYFASDRIAELEHKLGVPPQEVKPPILSEPQLVPPAPVVQSAPRRKASPLRRWFNWSMGLGENA